MIRPRSISGLGKAGKYFALFAIAIGGFGIGSSEFVSMGILPGIARGLLPELMATNPEVGIATAGWAVSAYAIGVMVGAPTISLLAVRYSRPKLIVVLVAGLLVGSLLSATMPSFPLMVLARFLAGLPHGAFFGVAALLAADIMGPGNQGKGIALALSGLTVANLVGVPVLTAFGQNLGWRMAYWLVAGVFALTLLLLFLAVPPQKPPRGRTVTQELSAFRSPRMWMVIGIECIGFTSFFALYGYIADISTNVAGLEEKYVPLILACAGLGMTLGNWLSGYVGDWSYRKGLFIAFPLNLLAFIALIAFMDNPVGLAIGLILTTACGGIVSPLMQAWLMTTAGTSVTVAAASHHGAFNVANSLGVIFGGLVIGAGLGFESAVYLGGALTMLGMVITFVGLWLDRHGIHDINAIGKGFDDPTFGINAVSTETGEIVAIGSGADGVSVAIVTDEMYALNVHEHKHVPEHRERESET